MEGTLYSVIMSNTVILASDWAVSDNCGMFSEFVCCVCRVLCSDIVLCFKAGIDFFPLQLFLIVL